MAEATSKVELSSRLRLLTVFAGAACTISSLIYIVVLLAPQLAFTGFIEGYVSLTSYELKYSHDGSFIKLVHIDYTRLVSTVILGSMLMLLALSIASTAMVVLRRGSWKPVSILYGVSNALTVSSGALRYLAQVFQADVSSILSLNSNGNPIVLRTSAGVIEYTGLSIRELHAYTVLFKTPLVILIPIAVAATLSATALIIAILKYGETALEAIKRIESKHAYRVNRAMSTCLIVLVLLVVNASVYTYYPLQVSIHPTPPPATLGIPPQHYVCRAVVRTYRGALNYTDFEATPRGWTSRGGIWSIVAEGYKGNAMQGEDNSRGIADSSQYYWNTSVSGYSSLWVSVKVRRTTGSDLTYRGLGLINSALNALYEISIYGGSIDVWRSNPSWIRLNRTTISGYISTAWYTIVANYVDNGTAVAFYIWVYDVNGSQVAYLTAIDASTYRFRPAYVGIQIDGTATILFDDFVVSTVDPRNLVFSNLQPNMIVEIWDNLGSLINSSMGTGALNLSITTDIVVGTGVDGRIVVKYPDGFPCMLYAVPAVDAIVGGDSYSLTIHPIYVSLGLNSTSANVTTYISSSSTSNTTFRALTISTTQLLYAKLILANYSTPPTLYLTLWIQGATNSTSIVFSGGAPLTNSTSSVALNIGSINYIAISGYFTSVSQAAELYLLLKLCTLRDAGACVYYPLAIELRG